MKIFIRIILSILSIIIAMFLVMAICMYNAKKNGDTPYFMNMTAFVNTGTSMLPVIHEGDLVVVKRQDTYENNDIISYTTSEGLTVTHRIIENSGGVYKTKGDNNTFIDGENISIHNVYGKMIFCIPGIGKTIIYLMGHKMAVIVILLALMGGFILLKVGSSYASKRNS